MEALRAPLPLPSLLSTLQRPPPPPGMNRLSQAHNAAFAACQLFAGLLAPAVAVREREPHAALLTPWTSHLAFSSPSDEGNTTLAGLAGEGEYL